MNNLTNNSQSTQVQQPLLQNQAPTLVIDLKRNRIRIHRRTLHLLGDPNYVQLMVNPKQSVIAIKSCRAQDYRSEKIRWETLGDKQCCEFYSKYLVKSLRNVCMDLAMIDVTGTDAQPGDEAIIFGDQLPIAELAEQLGTITYEILTGVSRRVKRIYYKE